jgi:hypothetical protein
MVILEAVTAMMIMMLWRVVGSSEWRRDVVEEFRSLRDAAKAKDQESKTMTTRSFGGLCN